MIGSHNSFTYLEAKSSLMEKLSGFWRCQSKTAKQQYDLGVRFFDIRIAPEKDGNKTKWRLCHGKADLKMVFVSIAALNNFIHRRFPKACYRLILEKGDQGEFKVQANKLIDNIEKNAGLYAIIIKKNWQVLYTKNDLKIREYYCHPLNWNTDMSLGYNLKHFDITQTNIKEYAKKHNPLITKEMIESTDELFFMDYV